MSTAANPAQPEVKIEICAATLIGAALGLAFLGFVVTLPLFYWKSGMTGWKLFGAASAVALLTGVVSYSRAGGKKKCITVNDQGIQIENEKERVQVDWSEVEGVNHWVHGMDYWEFRTPHRARPVVLKSFGFSPQQVKDLSAAIQLRKAITEEALGMKRMVEDAYIH